MVRISSSWIADGKRRAGAAPDRADPHVARRTRPHVPAGWMPSGNEMCARLPGRSRALEGAREADHVVADVLVGLRIEQRPARAAAGTPVLADVLAPGGAEILVERLHGHLAELVLVEDRDLRPFFRVVELRRVDVVELAPPEFGPLGVLESDRLALALDAFDRLGRLRKPKRQVHRRSAHWRVPGPSAPIQRCCCVQSPGRSPAFSFAPMALSRARFSGVSSAISASASPRSRS